MMARRLRTTQAGQGRRHQSDDDVVEPAVFLIFCPADHALVGDRLDRCRVRMPGLELPCARWAVGKPLASIAI